MTITGIIRPDLAGVSEITNTALIAAADVITPNASTVTTAMWYELHTASAGNGTGSPSILDPLDPPGPTYPYGTPIIVFSTPDTSSNVLVNPWSDNCEVVDYQCHVTLTGAMYVTATFALDTHTLSYSVTGKGHGSVLVNPTTGPYNYGTVVTLSALISPASIFMGWSGDITSALRTVTFTIQTDTSVVANFDTRRAFLPMALRP